MSDWNEFCIVDAASGRHLFQSKAAAQILCLAYSPDGAALAIGSDDGTVAVHDMRAQPLCRFKLPQRVSSAAFFPDGKKLAAASGTDVHVWNIDSRKEISKTSAGKPIRSMAVSPKGEYLATGDEGGQIRMWNVNGSRLVACLPFADIPVIQADPAAVKIEDLWTELSTEDSDKAARAMGTLLAVPEKTVDWFRERLEPAAENPKLAQRIRELVAQLDADEFAAREAASNELLNLGNSARPALQRAMEHPSSEEVRMRTRAILNGPMEAPPMTPEALRAARAIRLLERIGTPKAREVLEKLARGDIASLQTQQAEEALKRFGAAGR
jgi:hypothetical protein